MNHQLPGDRVALLDLLALKLDGKVDYEDFRTRFEEIYTFQLDRATLSLGEQAIFATLFSKVTRYSPFAADRKQYPGVYIDESGVDDAVREALKALSLLHGTHARNS